MAKTKTSLQVKVRIPHVILDTRGAELSLIESLMPGLEEIPARFRVLGEGMKKLPHVFSFEEALEEGHLWLVLSDKLPRQFSMIIDRGIVPVMLEGLHPEAHNYNPVEEIGNAFLFPKKAAWNIYGTLVRAVENFAFSYDWENLRSQGKELLA